MTTNPGKLFGCGIGFPPRIGSDGRLAVSVGEDNIRESIRIILMTEPKERLRLPDFGAGLNRFLFEPNNVATRALIRERIIAALTQWEPRILVESVSVDADTADPFAAVATIMYKLVATQQRERVALNVTLAST